MRTLVATDEIPRYVKAWSGKWHLYREEAESHGPTEHKALTMCDVVVIYTEKRNTAPPRLGRFCPLCFPKGQP